MSAYRSVFPKKHTLIAVIHAKDLVTTLRNVDIARENGADGVFLINHGHVRWFELLPMYVAARSRDSTAWIGLNILDLQAREAIAIAPNDCSGVWVDDAGVYGKEETVQAQCFIRHRESSQCKGLYFGGVAFKYQVKVRNPAEAARAAMPYMDVVTTSGPATGLPPDVAKVRDMKEAIGDYPLAVASGMTPDNVHLFMPWVDCFIVATGISSSFTELNPSLVRTFAEAIR
jgi:predicted TIM-barrel enzyme